MNTQIQNQKKTKTFRAPCRPLEFWALGFDSDFWFRISGFILAFAICSPLRADPGLVGEYFVDIYNMKQMDQLKKEPFLVRADPQVNFETVDGDFYGSHLTVNFGVRWTGSIHIAKPGKYTFHLASDDGSKLSVNGKEVIAFKKLRPMEDAAGEMTFDTAGDFPVKLLFNQMGGGAGCILSWQTPDSDKVEVVPASVLSHDKAAEAIKWDRADFDLYATDHHAWIKKHGKPYEKMDYGPFLSGTFKAPFPESNTTLKGIIVSLDKEHKTNILFDTEMCRYSAGWTSDNGEFIDYHGVAYDGAHGATPSIKGKQIFGTPNMPGWEHDGSWKDPRKEPYGNLPAEWCHYRGLYRCGDQTVLSYTVNGVGILDLPGCETVGDEVFVTRTLQVDPSKSPLKLLVSSSADTLDFKAPMGVEISFDKVLSNTYATIPAHDAPAQYTIVIMAAKPGLHAKPHDGYVIGKPVDFDSLLKGGPAHWGSPIETKGTLGKDDGPYTVDTITPPTNTPFDSWMRISGFDFFPDGHSAAVCTWNGDVWIVKGIDGSLDHLTWQRYASGLFQSLGLKIVNGDVYVSGRDQITRLHDLNGDGEADFYENFNNDCKVTAGFHEFQHDLETDSEGNFYYAKGGPVRPGGNGFEAQSEDNGCVMKVSPDGKKSEIYATGMRAPNGMSMGPNDMLTVSDNQGTWVPACRISFVTKGSFLGVPDTSHMTPKPDNYGNPICWFPYPGEGNAITDNSSGGAAWDTYGKWGPMDGRLIHLSYGTCSLFEVMFENVDGIWQGGCVKFPLDFDSGIMRARFNPIDGQLYVAGLKGWQTTAGKDGCFQRVRYTGKPVHMPTELHVLKDGIAITFTSPVDPTAAVDTDNWNIEDYNYIWSNAYGSPEVSRDNPKKKGHDIMDISAIDLSPDHKTVTIHIADLKPVMQMKTLMKIKAEDGSPMNWEVDSTINIVPGQQPIAVRQPTAH
jgi:hypothetical protein